MQKNTLIITTGAIAIAAALGGFAGGMKYEQGKQQTFFASPMTGNGTFQMGRSTGMMQGKGGTGMRAFRPINGEIISSDDTSITVKLPDGSSKIVMLSEKTEINTAQTAAKTDLKVGTTVAVFGQDNSDGSVTAQSIQLNPILRLNTKIDGTPSATAQP